MDLIERLRNYKENVSNDMIDEYVPIPECLEAADEIERLRAELAALKRELVATTLLAGNPQAIVQAQKRCQDLEAELAALKQQRAVPWGYQQSEPVAWMIPGAVTTNRDLANANGEYALPLYLAPQAAQVPHGWRLVPANSLVRIASLIDPEPVEFRGNRMVFQNPNAAEVLTKISAEVRAMLDAPQPTQVPTGVVKEYTASKLYISPQQEGK